MNIPTGDGSRDDGDGGRETGNGNGGREAGGNGAEESESGGGSIPGFVRPPVATPDISEAYQPPPVRQVQPSGTADLMLQFHRREQPR